jgi:glycosyltransferase involved in cell wall biosynthesis
MSDNKKIALVHDHLFQMGGAERVLFEFHKLYSQSPIYTIIYDKSKDILFKDAKIITSKLQNIPGILNRIPGSVHLFKFFIFSMPQAFEDFDFTDYDIVLSSVSGLAKGIKVPEKTKHFCYCHTPTRYLWSDLDSYVEKLKIPNLTKKMVAEKLKGLRQWDYDAAQRVDYFIANSEFIAQKIKKYYDRDSEVIYPPVEVDKFYSDPNKEDYYIVVSRLMPYKKVDLIVKAFNQLKLPLKVLGTGEQAEELKKMAKANIEFLGEVSDEVRGKYLSKAKAFLHPQEEDFGIAAVEAMASGCPVIAYGSGGALETVVDKETGIFFEEQNWESLAEAVLDFNKLEFNPEVIREYAQKFSSENFRKNIDEYIKSKVE